MFTGLIEAVGHIQSIQQTPAGCTLVVHAPDILDGVQLGDSIAIDGVCTTVVAFTPQTFTIEASPETLSKTVMGQYQPNSRVNLERPLLPTSRLGGHFVSGHVDGLARLVLTRPEGISTVYRFALQTPEQAVYLIPKGSIAISGISLTLNTVEDAQFEVAIIPHTLAHTNMGSFRTGDLVNIETDMIGKYLYRFYQQQQPDSAAASSPIDSGFLAQHGFTTPTRGVSP